MVPEPKSGFPVSLWAALDRGSPNTPREYHREGIGARQRIFRVFGKNVIIFVFVFIFSGYLKITVHVTTCLTVGVVFCIARDLRNR